jgi:hypothetical protein
MLDQVLLGILHTVVTVIIHGFAMLMVTHHARRLSNRHQVAPMWLEFVRVAYVVVILFVASILEAAWWAGNYVALGALETFEKALYFSMVTYTTLGYGDISLTEEWRLLSAFQAANGVIIMGWSTALVIAIVQRIYDAHHPEDKGIG